MRKSCFVIAILWLLALVRPAADDIPSDVTVHALAKPAGAEFNLVLRLPLSALRNVQLPTRGPGYLALAEAAPLVRGAARSLAATVALLENDRPVAPARLAASQISLAADRSFSSFDDAIAHVTGPSLPDTTELIGAQAWLDLLLVFPISSDRSTFSVRLPVGRLGVRVTTVLRFFPPAAAERAFEYQGDPGVIELDPRWHSAAGRFVVLGFEHILSGLDHLLFLFCLVIPFRRISQLLVIVTAFTIAHSITLAASALIAAPSPLWFRPLIESLIAISILYMAVENIIGAATMHRRWRLAFAFGLVHGFGFSFALKESLQFAGAHLGLSLLSFNVGVELGQILVLALLVPALRLVFRRVVEERMGTIVLSAFVAHTAWHWTDDRVERLRGFAWPAVTAAGVAITLRVIMVAIVVGGAWWLLRRVSRRGDPYDATNDSA